MKATRTRLTLVAAAAIGVGASVAFALPAGAAVSKSSAPTATVKLGDKATLDANGAVVFAPVKVACSRGSSGYLRVTVTENVNGFIASGTGSVDVSPCDNGKQSLSVAVTPTQRAFKVGVAFGQASVDTCNQYSCVDVLDQHNIQIVKK